MFQVSDVFEFEGRLWFARLGVWCQLSNGVVALVMTTLRGLNFEQCWVVRNEEVSTYIEKI